MITEGMDFTFLLLENYKKLNIREDELATIFMIRHFTEHGNPFVSADLLSLKMSLDVKKIDEILAHLLERNFIEYTTKGNKTVTTLRPLEEQLYREYQLTISRETKIESSKSAKEKIENIYGQFEKLLSRPLSQAEFARIREWVANGFSDTDIINALKEALSKGKKSLRSVDKILMNWEARNDIEKDGITTLGEDWDKNLEETIRIAKTPWIDSDDED